MAGRKLDGRVFEGKGRPYLQLRNSISRHTPLEISSNHVTECPAACGGLQLRNSLPVATVFILRGEGEWKKNQDMIKLLACSRSLIYLARYHFSENFGIGIEYLSADKILRTKHIVMS